MAKGILCGCTVVSETKCNLSLLYHDNSDLMNAIKGELSRQSKMPKI